ncbi:hypothetical protein SD70_20350 [Gordoniibacillus kamchatkensis]|uniref:Small, acid-soluble spore protein, alpha/beta type n=1 Tax=Gordoniibacillus kamchatkensis TaxID=1590651 RepID=A0ABR5AFD4_9BACL|nr:hypothetical protein SD70_20350 [Paenibacillus sp. VKM B-2647]
MGRRRRGIMSEDLKYELAKDLGFYDTVMREGWEGIRTKDAGNMVKRAIQIAEEKLARDYVSQARQQPSPAWQQPAQVQRQPVQVQRQAAQAPSYRPAWQPAQAQPSGTQPAYAFSRQSGFVPVNPAAVSPGFIPPQAPAEGGAAPSYMS